MKVGGAHDFIFQKCDFELWQRRVHFIIIAYMKLKTQQETIISFAFRAAILEWRLDDPQAFSTPVFNIEKCRADNPKNKSAAYSVASFNRCRFPLRCWCASVRIKIHLNKIIINELLYSLLPLAAAFDLYLENCVSHAVHCVRVCLSPLFNVSSLQQFLSLSF